MIPGYWLATEDILMHHFFAGFFAAYYCDGFISYFLRFFFHPEFCFVTLKSKIFAPDFMTFEHLCRTSVTGSTV
jgi:hypothetical protein